MLLVVITVLLADRQHSASWWGCSALSMAAPPFAVAPWHTSRRDLLNNALFLALSAAHANAAEGDGEADAWEDPRWASLGLRGTAVPLRSVKDAAAADTIGDMGLYPDPLLRHTAAPVCRVEGSFGPEVERVAELLLAGMRSNAITALQFGVDARIIVLRGGSSPRNTPLVFVNPTILSRSAEDKMVPWREVCLVLPPPSLSPVGEGVDLLRDDVVEVAAQDVRGVPFRYALKGEPARAFQHELDHLNGILIVDHAELKDLPREIARLEAPYHDERQRRAFSRPVYQGNGPLYY